MKPLRFLLFLISLHAFSQGYEFKKVVDLEATPVISQGRTGTCWSFSSTSFLESEIIRLTGKQIDLSELYTVKKTYPAKMENYIMRQGKAQLSEGGLAHDVLNAVKKYGLVPNQVYSGLVNVNQNRHDHSELIAVITALGETYASSKSGRLSNKWKAVTESVLNTYLGKDVPEFTYEGKNYTPQSFLEMTTLNPDDYISLTSFTHRPFYNNFILNIPDNWSNGSFYNIPLNELMQTINTALENGFTVELDCDVSENTFSSKHGVAVIPKLASDAKKAMTQPVAEKTIDQNYRQEQFENYATTDDHLMHITGILKDQNGNTYYMVKNSWGTDESRTTYGGYVHFSESYMRLKAISVTIHKDALPKTLAEKLF
ncbi:C1 family peptidase [Flagellimonas nanhaiensis]|uniref:Aminopeptidase n=1 Tax=Flagellimonas nanhaiensis TaxID=2292706 RepID=A0A371JUL2_9FLAO|nr:C1 family peptidase [Allomuricauda nanhaiensis]RDY61492.1 aminopeptidase [Allomuricauda nanhaiensis]